MSTVLTEDLIYEILSVVEEIPEGKVASYGQIAKLIGREKNASGIARVLFIWSKLVPFVFYSFLFGRTNNYTFQAAEILALQPSFLL